MLVIFSVVSSGQFSFNIAGIFSKEPSSHGIKEKSSSYIICILQNIMVFNIFFLCQSYECSCNCLCNCIVHFVRKASLSFFAIVQMAELFSPDSNLRFLELSSTLTPRILFQGYLISIIKIFLNLNILLLHSRY